MELNQYHHHEEEIMSSSSDQEVINHSDQENNNYDSLGIGRLYECVFCKRGFDTAQALGGHMNIHRRDRARNKPPTTSNNPNKLHQEDNYTGPRFYQQILATPSSYSYSRQSGNHVFASDDHNRDDKPPHLSHANYFPSYTTSSTQRNSDEYCDGDHLQPSNRLMVNPDEDWRLRLSLEFSSPTNMNLEESEQVAVNHNEAELDLELRLGGYDS